MRPVIWIGSSREDLRAMPPHRTDAFRAVYTAHFAEAIYVLHVFQKKSKHGIATPKPDMELIRRRFAEAERLHRERQS
jgi:phage-related protein